MLSVKANIGCCLPLRYRLDPVSTVNHLAFRMNLQAMGGLTTTDLRPRRQNTCPSLHAEEPELPRTVFTRTKMHTTSLDT